VEAAPGAAEHRVDEPTAGGLRMQDFIVTDFRIEGEEAPAETAAPGAPAQAAPAPRAPAPAPGFSSLWVVLFIIALAVLLVTLWRRRRPQGPLIQDPKLGLLNLLGEEGERLLAEDRPAVAPLFTTVREASDLPPPVCDVLVVYCDLGRDGGIFATEIGLRHLLRKSRARILVLASENKSEYCITAAQEAGQSGANLVLTMARNEAEMPELLAHLFADMKTGTPMPEAYNKLAPRGKIFLADGGDLVFASRQP
jgi:hypothetical protein